MDKEKAKTLTINEVFTELKTSSEGLTEREATDRLLQYGPNKLKDESKNKTLSIFLKQFRGSLVILLLAASILAFAIGDFNDGIVIAIILFINTGLGFLQESKSKKAIEKLQKLVGKECLVIREGSQKLIPEKQLVVGDVVILKEGDVVAADIKLFQEDDLTVDEAQLTGESMPVIKKIEGQNCLVFTGSTIQQGEARGVVYATGLDTELGKIAHLSSSTKRVTQYEKSLNTFSSFIIKVTFLTLAGVFIIKILIDHSNTDISTLALFVISLSITVVPEAMPVIVTVTLSKGALNLARKHVITKTLSSVEDLGNINVLCSDKTGTLTESKLSIKSITAKDPELYQIFAIAGLESLDEKRIKQQSPFDKAYLDYVPQDLKNVAHKFKRLKELPFDPLARRRRVVASDGKKTYLIEIGSTETLLELTGSKLKKEYMKIIRADGTIGLRHLAIAYKEIQYTKDFDILKNESGLKFVGFCSLEDKLRPSAKSTIKLAEKLGVSLKILSGDSREVTHYVAEQVGLLSKQQAVFIGDEIEQMTDSELSDVLKTHNAFARLNPEQKYRIIKLLKLHGNVVGYQGDGINDAPALKLADVAIAVNNATDVAKESADIVLLRSDIGVIVNGIKFGREIFININKYIRFTLVGNWGNFFALSALYLLSVYGLPILPIQLLLTSLLTDLPCIAIATDKVDKNELTRPSKFDIHSLMFISLFLGTLTAIFEIMYFAIVKSESPGISSTGLYLFLTLSGLVVIFSIRNKDHFWLAPKLSKAMKLAFVSVAVVSLGIVYLPITKRILHFSKFPFEMVVVMGLLTLIYFLSMDLVKVWFYKTEIGKNL